MTSSQSILLISTGKEHWEILERKANAVCIARKQCSWESLKAIKVRKWSLPYCEDYFHSRTLNILLAAETDSTLSRKCFSFRCPRRKIKRSLKITRERARGKVDLWGILSQVEPKLSLLPLRKKEILKVFIYILKLLRGSGCTLHSYNWMWTVRPCLKDSGLLL